MQRPDVFLWQTQARNPTQWPWNQERGRRRIVARLTHFETIQEKWRRDEAETAVLKEKLAQVTDSNQRQLKKQIKLINQLKQKNLEHHYLTRELKRERRLYYLLRLETDGRVDAAFSRPTNKFAHFSFPNYTFCKVFANFLQRWTDALCSWWFLGETTTSQD